MTQVPRHVLQDVFGNISIELITRDLRGRGKEDVSRGPRRGLGVEGGQSTFSQESEEGAWIAGIWEGIRSEIMGELQVPKKALERAARGRWTGWMSLL